jgi:hypothetical protein
MLVDLHAHRFWDDPKLEQEEVVSAGYEDDLAEMQRINAEKLAKAEKDGPKPAITPDEMRRRAVERARKLRERMMPPALRAPDKEEPVPAPPEPEEAPAPAPRPKAEPPPRPFLIPPAGSDDEWEDVVNETYD